MAKKTGHKSSTKLAIIIATILLLAIFVIFLLTASIFDISLVNVSGNTIHTDKEIADMVKGGDLNIFLFSKSSLKKKLESKQGIKRVTIKKELPNRLNISVEESYIMGKTIDGPEYYIDNQGEVKSDISGSILEEHKIIPVNLPAEYLNLGKKFSDDNRNIDFLRIIFMSEISTSISQVSFDKSYNIDIIVKDICVHFGNADNIYEKLSNLSAVLERIEKDNIQAAEIILNAGKNPIVVLKKNK